MPAELLAMDNLLRAWVVAHRFHAFDGLMWSLSVIGRGGMVFLVIGAGLAVARRLTFHDWLRLLLAILVTTVVSDYLIKPLVNRERPFARMANVDVIGGHPADASFPSGHAANACAGAFVLSLLVPSMRIGWWVLAAAISYSRIYLGVHYPLDVVAGAVVGSACAALVLRLTSRLTKSS